MKKRREIRASVFLAFLVLGIYFVSASGFVSFNAASVPNGAILNTGEFSIYLDSSSNLDHYSFVDFEDLALWMKFEDVNFSGDPIDSSGSGNNGVLKNGASINNIDSIYNEN